MSAQPYEPLRIVRPATTQAQMGWLLRARLAARRAFDAALTVPRKAAGFLSRAVHRLHLTGAASWLRTASMRLSRPLLTASRHLGLSGMLAAGTAFLTSPSARSLMASAGRLIGNGLGWVAGKLYSGLDRTLRCFGSPGTKAADGLFNAVVAFGGKLASVAGPVVHRVARFSDPTSAQARLLNGISRSFVVHKLLRAVIGNAWVRALAEAVLIPALLDSRLVQWVRRAAAQAFTRAQHLRQQAQELVDLEAQREPFLPFGEDEAQDVPNNRAERRAAQRQQRHQQ